MTPPGDLGRGSGLQLSPTKDLKSVNWGSEVICTAYRPRRMGLTRSGLLKVASLLDLLQARYTGGFLQHRYATSNFNCERRTPANAILVCKHHPNSMVDGPAHRLTLR